MIQCYNTNYYD